LRYVEDRFAVGDQALSDVLADAAAAFDGPDAVSVLVLGGEHRLVAVAVGAEPALRYFEQCTRSRSSEMVGNSAGSLR